MPSSSTSQFCVRPIQNSPAGIWTMFEEASSLRTGRAAKRHTTAIRLDKTLSLGFIAVLFEQWRDFVVTDELAAADRSGLHEFISAARWSVFDGLQPVDAERGKNGRDAVVHEWLYS